MFHLLSYLSVSKVFQKPFVIWFFMQIYRNKRWEHFARPVNLLIKRYISKYLGIYEEDNRATSSLRAEIQRGRFRSGVSIQHFVTRLWKSGWLVTSFNAKFSFSFSNQLFRNIEFPNVRSRVFDGDLIRHNKKQTRNVKNYQNSRITD